ncbi:MAG TPA: serine/threonine protein kinase [Thiomicrospira sp.]|nr:serine/threonine protein kinase [Thiomicrospira sp.]
MHDHLLDLLKQQHDIGSIKPIGKGRTAFVYKIKQRDKGESKKQLLRVIKNISPHYQIRREKDLLHYLNQFPEFIHFNEIRREQFYYLQFFDYKGKTNLQQHVSEHGVLNDAQAKHFLSQMISSLEKIHKVGFVHSDISPENILASKKGNYYLLSIGKAIPSLPSFEAELINGSHRYSAPERLNGHLTEASDVYSLGCSLYYALTGNHIYRLNKSKNVLEQFWAHTHHSIRKINRLPVLWRYLLLWMTQKDPTKRITLIELQNWLVEPAFPDWLRKQSYVSDSEYPKDPLSGLADEHYLYPTFKQALSAELGGDLITAFNLYENCAFKGYSRAENNLALMYEKGNPVKQSYVMAANMYKHAFEKGNPHAAYNLGRLFEYGQGVKQDLVKAYKLYEFSALRGNLIAQNKLAEMLRDGAGKSINIEQAKYWFSLAAYYGNVNALENLKKLA